MPEGDTIWRTAAARDARAVLTFDDSVAVLFSAPVLELVRDGHRPVEHLGPDVLAQRFDLVGVMERARRSSAKTIGELLLDQRVCAGIGNIYRCESLWLHGVDPCQRPHSCVTINCTACTRPPGI